MRRIRVWAVVIAAYLAPTAHAADRPPTKPLTDPGGVASLLDPGSTDALAGNLRGILVKALPDPLFEDHSHWGGQRWVAHGVTWRGKGLRVHPDVTRTLRNDGRWWRATVKAERLADTLVLDLRDVRQVEPGRMTFTTFVSFDAETDYEHQNWDAGVRLFSGEVRARLRVKLTLRCEAVARLEGTGKLLPDAVFRLRVLQSDLQYDNWVVEHIDGLGGEAAKLVGDAAKAGVEQWHPSLERNLLEKADAAIVKAGDTREVRIGVMKLLGGK